MKSGVQDNTKGIVALREQRREVDPTIVGVSSGVVDHEPGDVIGERLTDRRSTRDETIKPERVPI